MFDTKPALGVFACRKMLAMFGDDPDLAREHFRSWVLVEEEPVSSGARASPAPDDITG